MQMARRLEAMQVEKYKGLTRLSAQRAVWNGKVRQDWNSLSIPLSWRRPRKIFVNSMSDLFHESVQTDFIKAVWDVMARTPHHRYQILTKRPERMAEVVPGIVQEPLENVWLGTSIECAEVAHHLEHLRHIPAAIRFISFEPLIAPVGQLDLSNIHWAIVGGESGRNARPIREDWIDEIHDLCRIHGTAFFFKQWGTWGKDNKKRSKKANGREYRGKTWDEMPTSAPVGVL